MRPRLPLLGLLFTSLLFGNAASVAAATPTHFVVQPGKKLDFGRMVVEKGKSKWIKVSNRGAGFINIAWDHRPSQECESS